MDGEKTTEGFLNRERFRRFSPFNTSEPWAFPKGTFEMPVSERCLPTGEQPSAEPCAPDSSGEAALLAGMNHQMLAELLALGGDWSVAGTRWCAVTKSLFVTVRPFASFWASQHCPQCGGAVRGRGRVATQSWRHLDCMGARTMLVAELSKVACEDCRGAFRVAPAWEGRLSMFTRAFEAAALRLISHTSVPAAVKALQETEQRIWRLLFAYVEGTDGRLSALAMSAVRREWKRPRVLQGGLVRQVVGKPLDLVQHPAARTAKQKDVNQ
jgi:hypothetical protein